MDLLKVIAKIVECHVENSEIVGRGFLFELLLVVVSGYFVPESSVFFAGEAVPGALAPRISKFHEFVMHTFGVFQQGSRKLYYDGYTKV